MNTSPANQRVEHTGKGGEFFVIFLVNFLLTVLTLGIYSFWAKARKRRYLWSHTSFDNEQLEYTGTGYEMFLGFLKALGIGILLALGLVAIVTAVGMVAPALSAVIMVLAYLFMIMVAPSAALYGARSYMMSRTRYRGVRFSLVGSAIKYGFKAFGLGLLTLLTLGLFTPFASMKLTSTKLNNSFYGSERFEFDGKGGDLFGSFFVAWLLTIPTLGLIWVWYRGKSTRYVARHTKLGELRFDATFTTGQLYGLVITNFLLIVLTLGLGYAWVAIRNMRFDANHMTVAGKLDYAQIRQAAEKASATGEGFAEALDVEFGV